MGRDGLAPGFLNRVHPRYATPANAIIAMACWASLLTMGVALLTQFRLPVLEFGSYGLDPNLPAGKDPFDVITDFVIFGAVTFETLAVASVFVFRRRFPPERVKLSYRCLGYPVVPALYVAIMAAVLVNMFRKQTTESLIGVGFILVGAAVYKLFLARRPAPPAA
jgi:amino acid transporter